MLEIITSIFGGIVKFFKTAFSSVYLPVTLSVIGVGLGVLYFNAQKELKSERENRERDKQIMEQNFKAKSDSIKTYYDEKSKKEVSEKTSFLIKSVEELKSMNSGLYNQFKDTKGLIAGIQSNIESKLPGLISEGLKPIPDKIDTNKYTIPFKFDYKDEGITQTLVGGTTLRIVKGKPTTPMVSKLDTNMFGVKLTYAFVEKEGNYIVSASCPSKYISFNKLDNFITIPTKEVKVNPWSVGPYVGFGLNTDMTGTNSRFGFSVGVGVSYNLFAKTNGPKIFR